MRLLVIDDEPAVADALRRGLQADGFAVDVADNGVDGLWLAQGHGYAAIVLDVMLPGVNGYRLCADLRAAGDTTPVLMLTAKLGDDDEIAGLEAGADDYLTKPFSYRVLVTRLHALLRRGAIGPATRELTLGAVRLDTAQRRCFVGGDEVAMSPRAMAVLEHLMRHADEVCSKTEILDEVWDHDFAGNPNIVEVYVSRLRQALEPAGQVRLVTVRGSGYRLSA